MAEEYGYGRNQKTGKLNWRFRTFGNSPFNMLIEKGRDKLGLRSIFNVGGKGGRDDPNSERNIKKSQKLQEVNKKIQVLEQKKASLKSQTKFLAPSSKYKWFEDAHVKQAEKAKVADYQTEGKKKLLKQQTTRSLLTKDLKTKKPTSVKGGSAGQWQGGGGKRVMGIKSPWEWIKRRLD